MCRLGNGVIGWLGVGGGGCVGEEGGGENDASRSRIEAISPVRGFSIFTS